MPEIIGGRYTTLKDISVPGATQARIATSTDGSKVALMLGRVTTQADVDRYAARAQAESLLGHPDIARIVDWGSDGDVFYAAQEWIDGRDARSVLGERPGPFSAGVVAGVGARIAGALSAAHTRGVVHGDLRPGSIVMFGGEDVKLVGLGAPGADDARRLPADAPPEAAHYMSPEQARGSAATPASDIYALGCVLYELSAGRVPFDGPTGVDVAASHLQAEPEPVRRVNPEVPASLEAVIAKAMAKDPARRYVTAEDMRADLGRIGMDATIQMTAVTSTDVPVKPLPKRKSMVWAWALVAVLVAALAFGAWYLTRGTIAVPDVTGLTIEEATVALQDAGLAVGGVTYSDKFPDGVAEGAVFEQDPAAGTKVRDGAKVAVVIAGSELATVPDVVGLAESEALLAIRDAGFANGEITRQYSVDVESGLVISQTPAGQSDAPKGAPIAMVISRGKQVVAVPSVVGQTEADATNAIQAVDLVLTVEQAADDTVAEGLVISQSPEAGVSVDAGSQVTITVSTGPAAPSQVRVPAVTGLTQADAVAELEAAGLVAKVALVDDPANAGKVVSQTIDAGTMVDPGSTVGIQVGQ